VTGPLAGLRVVELCDGMGELAGKLLADMGADVIKVEPPAGSASRTVGPFVDDVPGPNRSLHFWYHNTNKRSLVLDAEDRATLRDLVLRADVVIEDGEPGRFAARVVPFADLSAAAPGLIICSITPFGQDGPWAQFRSTDMVSLALGGPMAMNGYDESDAPGAPPIRGHGDQGFNTGNHYALNGILAALLYRDHTGRGQHIDCSIHEALSQTVEVGMPYFLYKREDVVRQTARHAAAARTEPWYYVAKDGKGVILFGVGRDNSSWAKLRDWYQSEGYGPQLSEPRFDDPLSRQPGRQSPEAAEISAVSRQFIEAHTADEIYRGGQERRQSWGVVRAPDETLQDQHLWDRGFFVHTTGEGRKEPIPMPGAPYSFSATPWELRRPAPRLGEHTAEILAEVTRT